MWSGIWPDATASWTFRRDDLANQRIEQLFTDLDRTIKAVVLETLNLEQANITYSDPNVYDQLALKYA